MPGRRPPAAAERSLAQVALKRSTAEDVYCFSDDSTHTGSPARQAKGILPRSHEYYAGLQSKTLKRDDSPTKLSSPAAKRRRKAARCLEGVTCYCMIEDKSTKDRLQSVLKQLGGRLVKKWQDVLHNKEGSHVIVKNREPPPAGKLWRDRRFNRATIVTAAWVDECEAKRQRVDVAAFVPKVPVDRQLEKPVSEGSLCKLISERCATSDQCQADSSIAVSLGFEPTSQACHVPGIPTSDEEESGARSARLTLPEAAAEAQESQPSQAASLTLAYEETQKQEESDSEAAHSVAPASEAQQRDAHIKMQSAAAPKRRSKLSERMQSVSREIEEDERAEAAAKAAAATAAEEANLPSANESARVNTEAKSSLRAGPESEVKKIPEQHKSSASIHAPTINNTGDVRAAGVEILRIQQKEEKDTGAAATADVRSENSEPTASRVPSSAQRIDAAVVATRPAEAEFEGEDIIVPSSQPPPESQMSCGFSRADSFASPSMIQLNGDTGASDAGQAAFGTAVNLQHTTPTPVDDDASDCRTEKKLNQECALEPEASTPAARKTSKSGKAVQAGDKVTATHATAANTTTTAASMAEPRRGEHPDGKDDCGNAAACHSSVLVHESSDDDVEEDLDEDDKPLKDTRKRFQPLNQSPLAEKDSLRQTKLVEDGPPVALYSLHLSANSLRSDGNAAATAAPTPAPAARQANGIDVDVAGQPLNSGHEARASSASCVTTSTNSAVATIEVERVGGSKSGPSPESGAANAHDPETHRQKSQDKLVEEEEEAWRDPTVRALLVLRSGQALDKWLSAPGCVQLRNDVTTFGRLKATNDVVLANTSHHQISREGHARIYLPLPGVPEPSDAEPEIEDGQSRNGIFVNGIKVQRAALRSGDTVTFGGGEGVVCGAQLPLHCQRTPGLTLSYNFYTRHGTGRQLQVLYVAIEGSESRPIGMVRIQRRHTIADLRQIISFELDNPMPGQQYKFLHQSTIVAGSPSNSCSNVPSGGSTSVRGTTTGVLFAPVSMKQERRLQATTLMPIVVLRLINSGRE